MIRILKREQSHIKFLSRCALLLAFTITQGYAQQAQHFKELEELLESYPEQSDAVPSETPDTSSNPSLNTSSAKPNGQLRTVYSQRSRTKIGEVDANARYKLVRKDGRWSLVRFNSPTVPLWVSNDYIELEDGEALITANRLNARLQPSPSAPVIHKVRKGYRGQVLDSRRGYSRILVDRELVVAIETENATQEQSANPSGGWVHKTGPAKAKAQSDNSSLDQPETVTSKTQQGDAVLSESTFEGQVLSRKTDQERQHLIAPGDAISLLVFGEPDLSVENVRVPETGRVSLPLIGSIAVAGKTTQQVETKLKDTLSEGYIKNPRLSVTIFSYRPIFLRGAVRSTGAFPYTEGLSVAKAIALAGGSKNSATANGVSILRDGETVEQGLALDSQKQVESGDVITIAEELGVGEDAALFVYLHGEVANPGEYLYRRGLTVEKAIVLAGGFTLRGSSRKIKVTRYAGQGKDQEPIKVKGVKLHTPIEPGDVIKIGARWF